MKGKCALKFSSSRQDNNITGAAATKLEIDILRHCLLIIRINLVNFTFRLWHKTFHIAPAVQSIQSRSDEIKCDVEINFNRQKTAKVDILAAEIAVFHRDPDA